MGFRGISASIWGRAIAFSSLSSKRVVQLVALRVAAAVMPATIADLAMLAALANLADLLADLDIFANPARVTILLFFIFSHLLLVVKFRDRGLLGTPLLG